MKMSKMLFYTMITALTLFGCAGNTTKGGGTETGDPGNVEIIESGLIAGQVVIGESSNISLANAKIWVNDDTAKTVISSTGGKFSITGLVKGEYVLYAQWEDEGLLFMGKTNKITIDGVGEKFKTAFYIGALLMVDEPVQLTGRITYQGQPVVADIRLKFSPYSSISNKNGEFSFEQVPYGYYEMEIEYNKKTYQKSIILSSSGSSNIGNIDLADE